MPSNRRQAQMKRKRKLMKRITVDEGFDASEPMGRTMRSVMPPDQEMDPEARDQLMGHLLSVRRTIELGRERHTPTRSRRALVPALAIVLALFVAAAVMIPLFATGGKTIPPKVSGVAKFSNLLGKVEVLVPHDRWRAARPGDKISEGWVIRTAGSSNAAVDFPDGSIMRVTDGSEAEISTIAKDRIAVAHVSGSTYHRVTDGTDYVVTNKDVASHTSGAAFNVENRVPDHLEILTVEKQVNVAIARHDTIPVSKGEVMTVSMAQDKKADKQPVSRERLADERLMTSVQQDAAAGYSTGIYADMGVQVQESSAAAQPGDAQTPSIQLAADVSDKAATLTWVSSGGADFAEYVLLRSESAEPAYPGDEVARFSDPSMSTASDDSIQQGHTYQYRIAAIRKGSDEVFTSNTIVVNTPSPTPQPEQATLSLSAAGAGARAVRLQWSVGGATRFSGFILERVVDKAPAGSATPAGTKAVTQIDSGDVFCTYTDDAVVPGHTYNYRVGLVVDGSVMIYSDWQQAALATP